MSSSSSSPAAPAAQNPGDALAQFDATTSRWGPATMLLGLAAMLAGPLYLAFFGGLDIRPATVATAVLAIALAVGVIWVVEPISYFPILGPAAMYQAFLIGNISTKLLPSAITAQNRIRAEPGSARAQLASVIAISAAGLIHVASLILFVGILGSWLLAVVPPAFLSAVTAYVLPSVLGAFAVQLVLGHLDRPWLLLCGALVAVIVVLGILPLGPALGPLAPVLGVVLTVAAALTVPAASRRRN